MLLEDCLEALEEADDLVGVDCETVVVTRRGEGLLFVLVAGVLDALEEVEVLEDDLEPVVVVVVAGVLAGVDVLEDDLEPVVVVVLDGVEVEEEREPVDAAEEREVVVVAVIGDLEALDDVLSEEGIALREEDEETDDERLAEEEADADAERLADDVLAIR